METSETLTAYRGSLFYFTANPAEHESCYRFIEDGILLVDKGTIVDVGETASILKKHSQIPNIHHYPRALITPGFIDAHVHLPQLKVIASYGEELLEWLERYTFPSEQCFAELQHCVHEADFFIQQLLRNGTTTAAVFGTIHPASIDAFFERASQLNMCMIGGNVLMNCNAPDALLKNQEQSLRDSQQLIQKWHGYKRLHYAVTPRFALTSTASQLQSAGELLQSQTDLYLQTHLAETPDELQQVKRLFPDTKDYLAVYEKAGLLGPRSLFGHGIYLSDDEWRRLAASESKIIHCPTSNLFLGSGLFDLSKCLSQRLGLALGSDVGAGTSLSMLQTMAEAYKVYKLKSDAKDTLNSLQLWYQCTLGAARALALSNEIGNFELGKQADFIVLAPERSPLLKHRLQNCDSPEDYLFALQTLGDDRLIQATAICGNVIYRS